MYIIAGLGNPGKKYENTRHNMGFLVLDAFAQRHGIKVSKIKHKALTGEGFIAGKKALLVKPQTYMNLSVIYDDLDLEIGALRIRKKGSAGSHNGMKSVISQLQDDQFPRIRIGIGGADGRDWKDFVTGGVSKAEADILSETIDRAADAVTCMLEKGIDIAMNQYNTPKKKKEKICEAGDD